MRRWIVTVIAVLAAALALGATAVAVGAGRDPGSPPGPMMSGPAGGWMDGPRSDWMDGRESGWMGGMQGWMAGWTGSPVRSERAWLTEMVAHHEEAVAAAQELQRSDRQEMRDFGASIVDVQSTQIDLMNGWLDEWYGGPAAGVRYRPMMRDLSGLTGDRLDRVFLRDMVRHHMMAVMMSQQLLVRDLAKHPEVADLAEEIRDAQHQEIFAMQQWLADWFGGAWSHGMGHGHGHGHGTGPGMGPGMMRGWNR